MTDDLISRQAAVECLNGEMKLSSFENAQIVQDYLVRAVEKLYDLPPAQPEITETQVKEYCEKRCLVVLDSEFFHRLTSAQPEIVRCKDCKHYDTHDHRCKVWNHGVIVMGFCHRGEREEDGET